MRRTSKTRLAVGCLTLFFAIGISALGQSQPMQRVNADNASFSMQSKEGDSRKIGDKPSLTVAEVKLVDDSRNAILQTGISEPYFQTHFELLSAIDKPGDRRVIWKYSINGYEAILNDAVGYYTAENGRRVDVHSIKDAIGSTHDIEKTIPRKRAEGIMRSCIGAFVESTIVFKAATVSGKAQLLMTAASIRKDRDEDGREREEKRKESNEGKIQTHKRPELDTLREEGEDNEKPSYFGIVNLETGKCTKGKAVIAP